MKCTKCNGKGILPQYINGTTNNGICWRCGGSGILSVSENKRSIKRKRKEKPEVIRLKRRIEDYRNLLLKYGNIENIKKILEDAENELSNIQ